MPDSGDSERPPVAWIELPDRTTVVLTGECRIGRIKGNEIVNPDPRISRQNSLIQRQGHHFVLVDLGSTNGTFLNDARIFKPARLKDGDVIMVGSEHYLFRQPPYLDGPMTDPNLSVVRRTEVMVEKTFCWMLLVVPPAPPAAAAAGWLEPLRQTLVGTGAGVKRLPDGTLFVHWRDLRGVKEKVRALFLDLARQPRPPGARLVAHHGSVRVGPSSNPSEENLLGAEVSFTHQLARAAALLDAALLLSEPAAKSLGLESTARPLGEQVVGEMAGKHALFGL